MSLWNRIKSLVSKDADKYLYATIPQERTNIKYQDQALRANRSYLRLWLAEMFLTKSHRWFVEWQPAVHASANLTFGNQGPITFSRVVQPPQQALATGVLLGYPITDLLPFNGGTVEIEASLLALKGQNYLGSAIQVLQDFSSLVSAPLTQALTIAKKVSTGIETLLDATNGRIHLPFHQAFTGAGGSATTELKPGYLAVILATGDQVDVNRLYVKDDQLHYHEPRSNRIIPFRGYDYMLLRIESRQERDDFLKLKDIEEPYNKYFEAWGEGDTKRANAYKRAALIAAARSPDLTLLDRRRVAFALRDEFAAFDLEELGVRSLSLEAVERTLNDVIAERSLPLDDDAPLEELSFGELFEE